MLHRCQTWSLTLKDVQMLKELIQRHLDLSDEGNKKLYNKKLHKLNSSANNNSDDVMNHETGTACSKNYRYKKCSHDFGL
jgi:hypothetical protein